MNKLFKIGAILILGPCVPMAGFSASLTKVINEGQTVEMKIPIRLGYATLIEFPEPLTSAVLSDKSLFSCQRYSVKMICAANGEEGSSSNLIVTTFRSNFVLTLVSTNENVDSSVFFQYNINASAIAAHRKDPLTESFLKHFAVVKLDRSDETNGLSFKVSKSVELGDRLFILFDLKNQSDEKIEISDSELFIVSHGGLTGLPIRQTKIQEASFSVRKTILSSEENTEGIVSMRRPELSDTDELSVRLIAKGAKPYVLTVEHITL